MPDQYKIRTMKIKDLQIALDMATDEGWNPGLDDCAAFYTADPTGYFVGELNGELINVISAVRYGDDFGFIGLYICKPEYRCKGYGHLIWDHALGYLGNRVLGLDAVKEQTASYAEHGFKPVYRNVRHAGVSMCNTPMDPRVSQLGQGVFPSINDYDGRFFPAQRTEFMKTWTDPMSETRRGFVFAENGTVKGVGVLRQCQDGFKIGPLFADNPEIADTLFCALAGQVKGQTVILDTPEPNIAALLMAEKYELSPEFETFRMYRGPAPELPLDQIFGITTFELG
ncbi:MAG: GNAT family N-acetyltransferase [Roseibium sp.]